MKGPSPIETIVDETIATLTAKRGVEEWQRATIIGRAERACKARAAAYGFTGLSLTTTRKIAASVVAHALRDLTDGKLVRPFNQRSAS